MALQASQALQVVADAATAEPAELAYRAKAIMAERLEVSVAAAEEVQLVREATAEHLRAVLVERERLTPSRVPRLLTPLVVAEEVLRAVQELRAYQATVEHKTATARQAQQTVAVVVVVPVATSPSAQALAQAVRVESSCVI